MSATRTAVERALLENRGAVAAYGTTVRALPAEQWATPVREGAWSPAEITQHLLLTYRQVLAELEGGAAMAPRASRGWQRIFRWVVLPHILFHRSIPVRARAPRELRPAEPVAVERDALLDELEVAAREFERGVEPVALRGSPSFEHPYFGAIPPLKALRFVAAHTEHHRRQLARLVR